MSIEYFLTSKLNGNVIDIRGASWYSASQLISWPREPSGNDNQRWSLVEAGDGYYFVQSALNGQVIDIRGGSRANGAELIVWPRKDSDNDNQLWRLEHAPGGYYFLRSKLNGNVMDICGGSRANGAELISWPHKQEGVDNQLWSLEPAGISVNPLDYHTHSTTGAHAIALPVGKFVSVVATAQSAGNQSVSIKDSEGNEVFSASGKSSQGGILTTIGNGSFTSGGNGVYIVELTSRAGIIGSAMNMVYGGATYLTTYTFATNDGGAQAGDRDFNDLVVTIQVYRSRG